MSRLQRRIEPAAPITSDGLEAVLVLYKTSDTIANALRAHFLEGVTLQEAGAACGMTKQGFWKHVQKVVNKHSELQESLKLLRKQ